MKKQPTLVILRCDIGAAQKLPNVELGEVLNLYFEGVTGWTGDDDDHYASIFPNPENTIVRRVTLENFKDVIRSICPDPLSDDYAFLNICDGAEADGLPGPSVVKFLEDEKYLRFPCSYAFSSLSYQKIATKKKFAECGVSTAPWVAVGETWNEEKRQEVLKLKFPLIVKVSNFYCALGITNESRCDTIEQVEDHVKSMIPVYGSLYVEEFIIGREFIVQVVDGDDGSVFAYPPAEIAFPEHLPLEERFFNYDMETKDEEPIEFKVKPCPLEFREPLASLGIAAYRALGGKGFANVDIRQNTHTGVFYVLEVNDLPILSPGTLTEKTLSVSGHTLKDFGRKLLELTPYH